MVSLQSKIHPILLSDESFDSHLIRLVLNMKEIEFKLIFRGKSRTLDREIDLINPNQEFPYLIHRELGLYNTSTIVEYLEERYPQKPLMADHPTGKSLQRMTIYRLNKDIISNIDKAMKMEEGEKRDKLIKELSEIAAAWVNQLEDKKFFGGEIMSIEDLYFTLILWRFRILGLTFSEDQFPHISNYIKNTQYSEFFKSSLTDLDTDHL